LRTIERFRKIFSGQQIRESRPYIVLGEIRRILSPADQLKILLVTFVQIGLSILDLIGVAFIGVLTALTLNGIQSKKSTGTVSDILNKLGIADLTFQNQAAILGVIAGILLVSRTVLTLLFNKKLLVFLNLRGAKFSSLLLKKLLRQPLLVIQENSVQETIFLVTVGVGAITNGVLAIGVTLVADFALLIVMLVGLSIINPVVSIITSIVFVILGIGLYQQLKHRASKLAKYDMGLSILSNQKISEVITSYRESVVRNRREYYVELISDYRNKLAYAQAQAMFIPSISKYVVEMTLVVGALVLAASQFLVSDAIHAISTLSIFLAAGTRIAPAVLRMQQGAIQIKSNIAVSSNTLQLWKRITALEEQNSLVKTEPHRGSEEFVPSISLRNVSFRYPNQEILMFENLDFQIEPGEMVAIVGSSGAGKTTLVDLMLGVLEPTSGEALISKISSNMAIIQYAGSISYVPQDILVIDGTIRSNVGLGFPDENVRDDDIWEALRVAQLDDFVRTLPSGLDHEIGERGTNLSGGQRQRLGLARGMFTKPKLLVLDEATSSLDGTTEAGVTDMLKGLRGEVTIVVIAHRLSTIIDVERIIYLDEGRILAEGNFESLRLRVPELSRQIDSLSIFNKK
jgi:ABC-type multidrug transport system fused ATPase/permease subunit